ncbi:response regulator [Ramlibacter tataouinensis]|uniref:PAS domain-containing hybrid sensor histidine kinase/response regulator n=1 Tax=Ramlibacter tataouinensis TaxID=94132 RepID=UPI0022F3E617|nr:response regulator [Ramlibacter tataouinensis]WBY00390.1 response regulator [Ramlibacter tataouinensis]
MRPEPPASPSSDDIAGLRERLARVEAERDAARAALLECQATNDRLLSTLDACSDGILVIRPDGTRFFNIRTVEMWGLPELELEQLDTQALRKVMAAQLVDPEGFRRLVAATEADRRRTSTDLLEFRDGRVIERRVHPQVLHGRAVGSVLIYRDVSRQAQHEREMAFNSQVLENSGPMLWIDCATGVVTWANPAMCEHLGYSREEMLALSIEQFSDISAQQRREVSRSAAQGRIASFTARHRRKDGDWRDVDATMFLAEHGGRAMFVANVKDTTEEKAAQREAARQQTLLAALIDSIPDPIFYKDMDGVYLGSNAAHCRRQGRTREQILGRTCEQLYPAERAAAVRLRDNATLATLQPRVTEEWIVHGDGREVLYETLTAPMWGPQGAPIGMLGVSRDMTQRKRAEAELRDARDAAEAATRSKSDFLANMSHEIRTPMNAIIGLSHLVLKTELGPKQRDYLQKVQSAGQHLLRVINDILDFSKVEAGKLELERGEFDLEELLDTTSSLLADSAERKGLELVIEAEPEVPRLLQGDSLRLGQVLLNLAGNAVKFTERGEVGIGVAVRERQGGEALLEFRVRDTGIGLSAHQCARLFRSFSQADMSITRTHGGTGLGLAISKRLAELMGGEIGVESEPGKGSTFWFTARLGVSARQVREMLPRPDLRGRRALVVDDSFYARAALVDLLQEMTFEVSEAAGGLEAIDAVRTAAIEGRPYDVVYLDWRMPGINGVDTARRIRSLGLQQPPILMMVSAYSREELMREAERVGIETVLVKPVRPSSLHDATMDVLARSLGVRSAEREVDVAGDAPLQPDCLASIRGARILLVEDNDINQLVAQEILGEAGLEVTVAENGQVALEMVQSAYYDLVFMDMQMPVMDGVTATREIRKIARLARLPIVAMTASVMAHDREQCLQAGMNDTVTKPIDPKVLWAVLLRWIAPLHPAGGARAQQGAARTGRSEWDGIAGLDADQGLAVACGNRQLYRDLLARFVSGQGPVPVQIHDALANGQIGDAERLAHTLKGAAANVGAAPVAQFAAQLEVALRNYEPPAAVQERLRGLERTLGSLVAALAARLQAEPAAPESGSGHS